MAKGGGLLSEQIDLTLGVVKTPLTRVGDGPLPTQMGGKRLDKWYGGEAVNTAKAEGYSSVEKMALAKFSSFDWNDPDEVKLALALGVEGREFGATTGRPRRIAWPDLPLLRHAVQFNGSFVVLTKLDILSKCPVIKICTAYRYDGPDQWIDGKNCLKKGDMLSVAIPSAEVLEHCRPIYQEFPGWLCNIDQAKSVGELPPKCKRIIRFIEQQAGVKWQILSMGADRNQTIFRE
jgi:adenylosuccinate synthase